MTSIQKTRLRLLAIGMIAAPLLVIVGGFLFPTAPTLRGTYARIAAMGDGYLAVSAVLALGWALFLCSVAVFARLTPGRGGPLALVGGIIVSVGALATAGADWGTAIPQSAITAQIDATVSNSIDSHGLGLVLLVPMFFVSIGTLIASIGLLRSATTPRWLGVLLLIGAFIASFAGSVGPLSNLALLPLAVGFILLARSAWTATGTLDAAPAAAPVAAHPVQF